MIVTVTLNPAVDKVIKLAELTPGSLNRVQETKKYAGGKGINVARVIYKLEHPVLAISILGGESGRIIDDFLADEGLPRSIVWSKYPTRENIKILETGTGRETELNGEGRLEPHDYKLLMGELEINLKEAGILVLAGSLPRTLEPDCYARLIDLARKMGIKTILDTSGDPFRKALERAPYLIKPNLFEVEEFFKKEITDISGIRDALKYFLDTGVKIVVISMGKKGAVFASEDEFYWVKPPEVVDARLTVGAGDAMVAGLAVGVLENLNLRELALYSTAIATAQVKGEGINKKSVQEIKGSLEIHTV